MKHNGQGFSIFSQLHVDKSYLSFFMKEKINPFYVCLEILVLLCEKHQKCIILHSHVFVLAFL